jgi:hypothetical protein
MRMLRLLSAILAIAVLAACASITLPTGPSGKVDLLRDDLGSMLIAFDLPRGIGPAPTGSLFTFDVANGGPGEHLRLTPRLADLDSVPANLPPPGADRAYYLYVFGEADRFAIRAAQASALQRGATASNVTVGIVPKLCTAGFVDPSQVTISAFAVLPGRSALPFLNRQLLSVLLQQPGSTQMAPCG